MLVETLPSEVVTALGIVLGLLLIAALMKILSRRVRWLGWVLEWFQELFLGF
jgi:hypothetical protein